MSNLCMLGELLTDDELLAKANKAWQEVVAGFPPEEAARIRILCHLQRLHQDPPQLALDGIRFGCDVCCAMVTGADYADWWFCTKCFRGDICVACAATKGPTRPCPHCKEACWAAISAQERVDAQVAMTMLNKKPAIPVSKLVPLAFVPVPVPPVTGGAGVATALCRALAYKAV